MNKTIILIIFIIGQLYARSGFGYTIGFGSGGNFMLPTETDNGTSVEWIDYNGFMYGAFDYAQNNLILSLGGKSIVGNILLNGMKESNDNELNSTYISFGFQDLFEMIKIIEKIKGFDYLKFSSSMIYSMDKYGWVKKNTNSSVGLGISIKLVSLGIWEPYISYTIFKGSYSSSLSMGISLFLNNDE